MVIPEVGNFTLNGKIYEQNEIEFLPTKVEEAADQLMIAKWVIRNLAYSYGLDITFAPKITVGKAGSGLHVHMRIMKDGKNQMLADGALSETARKSDCRNDATGSFDYCVRKYESNLLLPFGSSSGSSDKRLLGRPEPFRYWYVSP